MTQLWTLDGTRVAAAETWTGAGRVTGATGGLGRVGPERANEEEPIMIDHYVLDGHTPVPARDLIAWARWFDGAGDDRIVRQETLPGGARVSTVFLGLNYAFRDGPPLLFETMVFWDGQALDQACARCSTWAEAEAQHAAMVARVQQAVPRG